VKVLGLFAIIGGGLLFAYLYFTGALSGVDTGGAVGKAGDAAGQAGQHGLDWFLSTAWAPAALIAVVGAFVLLKFWNSIGGFGRATLLVVGAIAVTIFVLGIQR
jgi:hypothetical protein